MRGEYLFRRGRAGIFYFRWPVPRPLQESLGKKQVWKSLGTQNYELAQCRAARMWATLTEEALGMGTGDNTLYDLKVLFSRVARPDGTETTDKSITISGIDTREDMERAKTGPSGTLEAFYGGASATQPALGTEKTGRAAPKGSTRAESWTSLDKNSAAKPGLRAPAVHIAPPLVIQPPF